jgi:hypothetical protein
MGQNKPNEGLLDHILYLLVLPEGGAGAFTPFQGFSSNTSAAVPAVVHICRHLPPTITDVFRSREEAIGWRTAGLAGYAIVLLDLEFLPDFKIGLPTCVVSCGGTREAVQAHIGQNGRREWLHLTTQEKTDEVPELWSFSRADIFLWGRRNVERIVAERAAAGGATPNAQLRSFIEWPRSSIAVSWQPHNITAPTEIALNSIGFAVTHGGERLVAQSDDKFARAIREYADTLEGIRDREIPEPHGVPGTPRLIVTAPSVFRHLSPRGFKREATGPVRRAVRNVLRQQQYIAMRGSPQAHLEMLNDPMASRALAVRADELRAYSAALSVTAASLCAPVLRCPPQVDRVRELLVKLSGLSRGAAPKAERRNKLARDIGRALRAAIPDELFTKIAQYQNEGIKLIGDTALELLPVDDLPLGLRSVTSRMPTLPGNLLMRQGLFHASTLIQPDDLRRVLIVRAFEDGDPLRDVLVKAVDTFNAVSSNPLSLIVVDVKSKDEFLKAFNDYDGTLAVFDGHGTHGRSDPQGTLSVGPIKFNPFELYGKIRVPPIVFLSACETYNLEGMESSVASAFLFMGARSVLGTLGPIDGVHAGILIGRFCLRFNDFVPFVGSTLPWSQVVTGMLRMAYVTDVLMELRRQLAFDVELYLAIDAEINTAINTFQPGWFEGLLRSVARAGLVSEAQVRDIWLRTCYFTNTLNYVHFGTPEHIFVVPNVPSERDAHTPT